MSDVYNTLHSTASVLGKTLHSGLSGQYMVTIIFSFFCFIRNLGEFPKILAIAVDSLLISCDDQESDVRLVAGESLNKLIKVGHT